MQHLGLRQYDRECCPGCQLHQSILDEPDQFMFVFEKRSCRICTAREKYMRELADLDTQHAKKFKDHQPPPEIQRPTDGVHVSMRQARPDDVARAEKRRKKHQGGGDD